MGNGARRRNRTADTRIFNPLGKRMKRGTPNRSSSRRTCWLIADCVNPNSRAAAVKLRCLAEHSKARNQVRGGSFLRTSLNLAISVCNDADLD